MNSQNSNDSVFTNSFLHWKFSLIHFYIGKMTIDILAAVVSLINVVKTQED